MGVLDNLVGQLYSAGATSVSNILFSEDNQGKSEETAIAQAILNAQGKAKGIAKNSKKHLGRMVSVSPVENQEGITTGLVSTDNPGSPAFIYLIKQVSVVFEIK